MFRQLFLHAAVERDGLFELTLLHQNISVQLHRWRTGRVASACGFNGAQGFCIKTGFEEYIRQIKLQRPVARRLLNRPLPVSSSILPITVFFITLGYPLQTDYFL